MSNKNFAKQLTKLALGAIVVTALVVFYQYWLLPRLSGPQRVLQELNSVQSRVLWPDLNQFEIAAAKIIDESDNHVVIRYRYSGLTTDALTQACGSVGNQQSSSGWGCTPTVVQQRSEGEFDIRYSLSRQAPLRICSDHVIVNVYDGQGSVIYEHEFALAKVWHREPGLWSWYQYRKHGCNESMSSQAS